MVGKDPILSFLEIPYFSWGRFAVVVFFGTSRHPRLGSGHDEPSTHSSWRSSTRDIAVLLRARVVFLEKKKPAKIHDFG